VKNVDRETSGGHPRRQDTWSRQQAADARNDADTSPRRRPLSGKGLLYITTVGARSGRQRTNPVARFEDGQGGWYVVASAGGAARHPAWYHNLAAHPDQVWVQVGGMKRRVKVEQLSGDERSEVWEQVVVARVPNFGAYPQKTDREIPVLRLTPVS
jgi:deazaflavin-dependent oxidoreductase (nitroreductase family)